LWHAAKNSAPDNERAIEFFQRAIAQDVTFTSAYAGLVSAYADSGMAYALRSLDEAVKLAGVWARKAAEIDPNDVEVQLAVGVVAHFAGRREEASECASLALATNPYSPQANAARGSLLIFNGEPAEGRNLVRKALRLNPRDPRGGDRGTMIAMSYYHENDYCRAIEAARRTIARYPGYPAAYCCLAASLGQLGHVNEANTALQNAMEIAPR
jgi:tetratricopeptide (TPR) repeat protein